MAAMTAMPTSMGGTPLLLETLGEGGVLRLTSRGVMLSNEVFQEFVT